MAMQKCHIIKDNQNKQITALCYNQLKHEIVAGLEGNIISLKDLFRVKVNRPSTHGIVQSKSIKKFPAR